MKIYPLYFVWLLILCSACDFRNESGTHKLSHRKVFVINDKTDTASTNKKNLSPNSDTSYIEYVFKAYDLVNIKSLDTSIRVDLRYADTSNFLKLNLYDGLKNAYFNCETALRIAAAHYYLKQNHPDLSLLILDASRPQHVQQMMWDSLKMHPDLKFNYLAPPYETSLHNYGCAVDVTIIDCKTSKPLDMGTDYDFFGKLSEPVFETKFLKSGELSLQAYINRLILRKVMQRAGLNPINSEWWHFSICNKAEAVAKYKLIK